MLEPNRIYCVDCLEGMKKLDGGSVDLVLTDPPYGITSNEWDNEINLGPLWKELKRIGKDCCAFIFTASQPFSSKMVMSNLEMFRHEWVWQKNRGSNFGNTSREPMKEHESVLVFSNGRWTYNPIMQERSGTGKGRIVYELNWKSKSKNYREFEGRLNQRRPELRLPGSIQKFNIETGLHPTQKPSALFEYLVKTYSNMGDLVLDTFMGSGTTAAACKRLQRRFIGFEIKPEFVKTAEKRLSEQPLLDSGFGKMDADSEGH